MIQIRVKKQNKMYSFPLMLIIMPTIVTFAVNDVIHNAPRWWTMPRALVWRESRHTNDTTTCIYCWVLESPFHFDYRAGLFLPSLAFSSRTHTPIIARHNVDQLHTPIDTAQHRQRHTSWMIRSMVKDPPTFHFKINLSPCSVSSVVREYVRGDELYLIDSAGAHKKRYDGINSKIEKWWALNRRRTQSNTWSINDGIMVWACLFFFL